MSEWVWILTGGIFGFFLGGGLMWRWVEDLFPVIATAVCTALFGAMLAGLAVFIVDESTEPLSGRVTGKEYQEAFWYTTTQCTTVGKSTTCVPVQHYSPECYEVFYEDSDGNAGDDCVSPEEFERATVGSWHEGDGE